MISELLLDKKIDQTTINGLLDGLYQPGVDYTDLYFQHSLSESWMLDDKIIQDGSYHITHGVGVRATSDDKVGFAYSDELNLSAINTAAKFSRDAIAKTNKHPKKQSIKPISSQDIKQRYTKDNPLNSISDKDKIILLKDIDNQLRQDPITQSVSVSLSGAYTEVLIASSDGVYALDYRPMVRLSISIIVSDNGRIEQANSGGGGRYTYQYFAQNDLAKHYADQALKQAKVALKSQPSPAGKMPVVLASGWPGVLLHEAIGHGLEGDFNRKKTSVYTDKINQQIASSPCTIVDNGTLKNRRGSLNIDDEGTPTQNTVLVEDGILKNYMLDKHNAKLTNTTSTGNARRESYAHLPMPRMTNTYMLAGQSKLQDMISSVESGIYAVNFDGGQVDVTSGKFVFSANEAYLIKNGKIQHPIKGTTLIGQGDEVLKDISMVGDDLALDSGVGVCGKEGQSVPVGVGQPSLKIDQLTVGGVEI